MKLWAFYNVVSEVATHNLFVFYLFQANLYVHVQSITHFRGGFKRKGGGLLPGSHVGSYLQLSVPHGESNAPSSDTALHLAGTQEPFCSHLLLLPSATVHQTLFSSHWVETDSEPDFPKEVCNTEC